MNEFEVAIANLSVRFQIDNDNFFRRMEKRFREFIISTEENPATIFLNLSEESLKTNWEEPLIQWDETGCSVSSPGVRGQIDINKRKAIFEVSPYRTIPEIEHLIRLASALWIYKAGGMMFHAAGISRENKGYLFSGQSGAGKTTVCRVSRDVVILNDDLVVLTPQKGEWWVWATPFSNPTQVQPNMGSAKLYAILNLVQDLNHRIIPTHPAAAAADLMTHIPFLGSHKEFIEDIFLRCISIVKNAETYELHFLPDNGFWSLIP